MLSNGLIKPETEENVTIHFKPINLKRPIRSRSFRKQIGWSHVADRKIYFRSSWELKFAKYLQWLKEQKLILEWEHEPQTFWFEKIRRGTRSYLPDFKVFRHDGTHYWVEVKGFFDRKSLTKIKRFRKYYPNEELIIVDSEWFSKNGKTHPILKEMVEEGAAI